VSEHKTHVGIVTGNYGDGGMEYWFEDEQEKFRKLLFDDDDHANEVPWNTKVALCMSAEDGAYRACNHPYWFREVRS